jgi:cytochrome c6
MKNQIRLAAVGVMVASLATAAFAQDSGADTYKAKCQMCHAADGSGSTPAGKAMGVLPFKRPDAVKMSDADLIAIVKNGKGKMPAFSGKLPDAQITGIVAYIRTLQK